MKYIVILGDGMSDYPDQDGQTPLSLAHKPNIDRLASVSEVGLCQTIPSGMNPGSDTANLSVMGYDPKIYYTGRSPLEAISMGIRLEEGDITYRVNLVTLSDEKEYTQKTMLDYSAGEIKTADSRKLIELLKPCVPKGFELFAGVSYRHCLVQRKSAAHKTQDIAVIQKSFTPPHDITNKKITDYLPKSADFSAFTEFMEKSYAVLSRHPDNRTKANSAWIWGAGTKPALPDFKKEYGINGAVISAVDLLKGIGLGSGLKSINVDGATGNLHTNFDGKAAAAIQELETCDFLYLHIEAPDECGHQGDKTGKIRAIELIDQKIVGPVCLALKQKHDFKMLIMPDHATPLALKTHTSDPVPYVLYDSKNEVKSSASSYTEAIAKTTGIFVDAGCKMIKKLLS